MKEFLEQNGYKLWKEDKDEMSISQKYQKRLDTLHKYKDAPCVNAMINYLLTLIIGVLKLTVLLLKAVAFT